MSDVPFSHKVNPNVVRSILPMMREYISQRSDPEHVEDCFPIIEHPRIVKQPTAQPAAVHSLHRPSPATNNVDALQRPTVAASVNVDIFKKSRYIASTAKLQSLLSKYDDLRCNNISIAAWSPMLVSETEKIAPTAWSKPQPFRLSVALFVVQSAFKVLNLPSVLFDDLCSGLFCSHVGIDCARPESNDSVAFWFHRTAELQAENTRLQEAYDRVLAENTNFKRRKSVAEQNTRLSSLKLHFSNWRAAARQSQCWRRSTQLQQSSKSRFAWKRITFYAWKCFVAMARVESDLDKTINESNATREKMANDLTTMQIQFKKTRDEDKRILEASLRDSAATNAPAVDSHSMDKLKLQIQDLQAATQEQTKIIRRLEVEVKDHAVTHEKNVSALRSTADMFLDNFASLVSGRRLTTLRAFDIVANCDPAKNVDGLHSGPSRASFSAEQPTFDIVSQPVVHTGEALLLAWANLLLASCGHSSVKVIGGDFIDASPYFHILHVFNPTSSLLDTLSEESIPNRFSRLLKFVNEQSTQSSTQRRRLHSLRATAATASEQNGVWSFLTISNLVAGEEVSHYVLLNACFQLYTRTTVFSPLCGATEGILWDLLREYIESNERISRSLTLEYEATPATLKSLTDEVTSATHLIERSFASFELLRSKIDIYLTGRLMRRLLHPVAISHMFARAGDRRPSSFCFVDESSSPFAKLEHLVPPTARRSELIQSIAENSSILSSVFTHFGKNKRRLSQKETIEFFTALALPQEIFSVAKSYSNSGELETLGFTLMCADIALRMFPSLSPAESFSRFVENELCCLVRVPFFYEPAFRIFRNGRAQFAKGSNEFLSELFQSFSKRTDSTAGALEKFLETIGLQNCLSVNDFQLFAAATSATDFECNFEIVFGESMFFDFIAALACVKYPSPFLTLAAKVDRLVAELKSRR